MARVSTDESRERAEGKRWRDLLPSCTGRRTTSSYRRARSVCRLPVASGFDQPAGDSELFVVRSAGTRSLPHQREKRIQWNWKLVSVHSRARRRCPGCQRATGNLYFAARREFGGSAERRRGRNTRNGDATRARRGKITTAGLVDLWSPRWRQSSLCGRIAFSTKTVSARTKLHPVQQTCCHRQVGDGLRCS